MRHVTALLFSAILVCAAGITVLAHEMTFKGTVMAVELGKVSKIKVNVVDQQTKKTKEVVFEIDGETKVLRGDVVVKIAEAHIEKGEQIAVTVNLDDSDILADVVRLPAKKK